MAGRRFPIVAAVAVAVAAPAAFGAPEPAAAAVQDPGVTRAVVKTSAEAGAIELTAERNGSLAATLTWSGGSGPYDVQIDANGGERRYETDVDDTTLTVAAEPRQSYCYRVFGSDGSKSSRECVSARTP